MSSSPEPVENKSSKYKFGVTAGSNFTGGKSRGMDAAFGSFSGQAFAKVAEKDGEASTGAYGVTFGRGDDLMTATAKHSLNQIKEKWIQKNKARVASSLAGSLQIPDDSPIGVIYATLTNTIEDSLAKIFEAEVGNCIRRLQEDVDFEYRPDMYIRAEAKVEDELWIARNGDRLQKELVEKNAASWRQEYADQNREAVIESLMVSERPKVVTLLTDGYEPPALAELKEEYVEDLVCDAQSGAEVVEAHKMGDEMSALNRMLYSTTSTIRTYCVHALSMFADQASSATPVHEQNAEQQPPRSPIDESYDEPDSSIKVEPEDDTNDQAHRSTSPSSPSEPKPATPNDGQPKPSPADKHNDHPKAEERACNKQASAEVTPDLPDYQSENDTELCSFNDPEATAPGEFNTTKTKSCEATPTPERVTKRPSGDKRKRANDNESPSKKARLSPDGVDTTETAKVETAGRKTRAAKPKQGGVAMAKMM